MNGCFHSVEQIQVTDYTAEKSANVAQNYIGTEYKWGGRKPPKFDCSGLITYSYKQAIGENEIFRYGNEVVDDANMQMLYDYNVQLLPLEKVNKGDVVFITKKEDKITHGGLFIEWIDEYNKFKFINASSYHEEVVIEEWPVNEEKRDQWFIGIGRLKIAY